MSLDQADQPLSTVDWPVHTDRLVLRPSVPADSDAIRGYRRLPEVYRWIGAAPDDRDWPAYFERRLASTVVIELDGSIIGDLMISIQDGWAQVEVADRARGSVAELGWVIDPGYAGNGYATEAVREAIRICFTDLGLRRITANCFADNVPSWRLMERLGMRRELATKKESLHRDLGWLDGYGYALLAEEWQH